MNKLALIGFITLFTFTQAKIIDAIAFVVEGEPVTTSELFAVQKQLNVPKQKAVSMLIQDRLQKVAMKDIFIDEKIIDEKISSIAKQNSITVPKMQKILLSQGTTWSLYRANMKKALKKEKFFQEKVVASIPKPSEEELKLFYNSHKKQFILPKKLQLIEYSAPTQKAIKNFLQTRNEQGITRQRVEKLTKELDETLLTKFLQTQDGSFTRPLNAGDRYITYKVLSKEGEETMPFELAKGAVFGRWRQTQQKKALKEYFEKLRNNADIQILR